MFTPQALAWLELLLRERFGAPLQLRQTGQNLTISRRDLPGQIVFDAPESRFLVGGFDPGFLSWDASREGWSPPLGKSLPAPGMRRLGGHLIENLDGDYRIHYDVLAMAYWTLNRIEELEAPEPDAHERFRSSVAHACRHGYQERPLVDEWFHVLRQVMARLWPSQPLNEPKYRTWTSHDVDRPSRYGFTTFGQLLRRMGGDVLRRKRLLDAVRAPVIRHATRHELHPDDPWNTFHWLMDVSEREGLQSTFFFIAGRTDPRFDATYEPEHPAIQSLIRQIHSRNHEIGLHPSYRAGVEEGAVRGEALRLLQVCADNGVVLEGWGARMHYLRWQHPRTLEVLAAAGAAYDSTMTFPDRCGFRCGTCHEFPAFSPRENRILGMRIRPLVVMESAVIDSMGLGVSSAAYTKFVELKAACRAVGGVFSVLWHNSSLDDAPLKELYEQVIKA